MRSAASTCRCTGLHGQSDAVASGKRQDLRDALGERIRPREAHARRRITRTCSRMPIGGNVRRTRSRSALWLHEGWFFLGLWLALCLVAVAAYLLGDQP